MTLPFRFHRGEFATGFFVSSLLTFMNSVVTKGMSTNIYDELAYWANVQFETLNSGQNDIPIRTSDLLGIGAIAGVFPLFFEGGYWPGTLFFSESYMVNGSQRSERGLYNTQTEVFNFFNTQNDTYPNDITTQATPNLKSSLIPAGQSVVGYVAQGATLFNTDGSINWSVVQPTPPSSGAYDPFYGGNFSTLSVDAIVITQLGSDLILAMIEQLQQIRYNGPSLQLLLNLTQIICEDAINNVSIVPGTLGGTYYYVLNYSVNAGSTASLGQQRISLWRYVVGQKFKMFLLNEV